MYGELIPLGGGDPIPLVKPNLLVGRRESCDIVLRFGNVSAHHCELMIERGYWFVKDLNSRNGTKVNGLRVTAKKRIDPGDRLAIAKHNYEMRYSPADLGAEGPPPDETVLSDILSQSLVKSAGLERRERQERQGRIGLRHPESAESDAGESADVADGGEDDEFLEELLGGEAAADKDGPPSEENSLNEDAAADEDAPQRPQGA